ncbi:MAG TPA: sugar phosphate isomerase/epimerase family protein [Planctomycetota bacterium]|nr:sugar phosphate isomerase/epimerase family protein [Planctomycetota bacterium]
MFKNLNCGALGHKVSSFEETVKLAKEFGFAGVDPDLAYAREKGISATKELLAQHGLKLGGFSLSVKWREADSETVYADSLENFIGECRIAAELGVTRCATWVMPCSDKLTYKEHFDFFVTRLRPVAQILKSYGISLGLEFIGPRTLRVSRKHGFIYTMDGMRAAAAAIGTGNIGFLLDSFHWYTAQATVSDIEQLETRDVVYVHVNDGVAGVAVTEQLDNKRELPGNGVIDLKGFFGALRKIGYEGPVTVEPFNQAVREMKIADAVKATSQALDKAMK